MDRIVVYGLGKMFSLYKDSLESKFEIAGYCDRNELDIEGYVHINQISALRYDYLVITSLKYFYDIYEDLIKNGVEAERIKSIAKLEVFTNIWGGDSVRGGYVLWMRRGYYCFANT